MESKQAHDLFEKNASDRLKKKVSEMKPEDQEVEIQKFAEKYVLTNLRLSLKYHKESLLEKAGKVVVYCAAAWVVFGVLNAASSRISGWLSKPKTDELSNDIALPPIGEPTN